MDRLSFVNVFVRDIKALPDFYAALFELEEETAYRSPIFRALRTGEIAIGFNGPEAYEILGLEAPAAPAGPGFALTFDVGTASEVGPRTQAALALGATLVKGPYETAYGAVQSVLFDPEANVFRINAAAS